MLKINKTIVFILLAVVILVSGVLFVYFFIYKTPQRVVKDMQNKMTNIKTVHYKSNNNITADIEESNAKLVLNIEGDSDKRDDNNPKDFLKLAVGGDYLLFSLDTEAEIKSLNKDLFFKINKVPNISGLYFGSLDFVNKWAKTEISNPNKGEEVSNLIKDPDLFKKEIKVLKSEKIEGVGTFHYKVLINRDSLLKFVNDNIEDTIFTPQEASDIKKSVNTLDDVPAEIWIGKRNNYLYKIKGNISLDISSKKIAIDFSIVFTNFDQDLKIEAPAKFEPAEKVFSGLLGDLQKLQTQNIPG